MGRRRYRAGGAVPLTTSGRTDRDVDAVIAGNVDNTPEPAIEHAPEPLVDDATTALRNRIHEQQRSEELLQQLAAIGMILIMLGAIYKKIFEWHTGFWGEKSSGWHYELIFVVMCLVVLFTNGGRYVLMR